MTENPAQREQRATRPNAAMSEARPQEGEPTIAALVSGLISDAQELARKEIQLAKVEVKQEVDRTIQGTIALAAGAITIGLAAILLLFAIVYALAETLNWPLWASFSLVGAVVLAIGLIALSVGKARVAKVDPVPHETLDSLRKDVTWIKNQTS